MYRLSRLAVLFFLAALSVRAQTFSNVVVPYSGNFARIVTNQKFSFYKAGATGNNVAYILNVQPGNAINLYVTAKSATFTSTDNLNINFFVTGNPGVSSCTIGGSFVDGWTPTIVSTYINGVQSGTPGQIAHFTFAAATTAYATTGILNAAQVCVQVVNNSTGGANDTLDMYASFTPNATATGSAAGGTANCVVSQTGGNTTVAGTVIPIQCDGTSGVNNGLYLGHQVTASPGSLFATMVNAFGASGGGTHTPLLVGLCVFKSVGCAVMQGSNDFALGSSPLVSQGGRYAVLTTQGFSLGTTPVLIGTNSSQAASGVSTGCQITVTVVGAPTGTAPTLDIYFQDQVQGNGVWNDRVHFIQFTAAGQQIAYISAYSASVAPYNVQNTAIAAGTVVNGLINSPWRFVAVVGGTASPNFSNVNLWIDCN